MPLPATGQVWPPKQLKPAADLWDLHDAWWVGDPDILASVYRNRPYQNHPAQYRGGIVGVAARFWWGKPMAEGEQRVKLHLPLPADISMMSADLLFSEPPRVVLPDSSSTAKDGTIVKSSEQEAVEAIVNIPEVFTTLNEAADSQSALGGVYLRLTYDRERLEHVMVETVDADVAVPSFQNRLLNDVYFWSVVSDEGDSTVARFVELHESGRISFALYEGTTDNLGRQVPLEGNEQTQWVAQVPGAMSDGLTTTILTGVDGLTVCYVPNMRPNKQFRRSAFLSSFGRSDYSGLEHGFDAVDEAWTSWARDVRLAKARIIVPEQYLDSLGPGQGSSFDTEREVYEGLNFLTSDAQGRTITPQQFDIRVAAHRDTITEWTKYILHAAGYSQVSLGEKGDAPMRTATQVTAEERLSERTRDKKIGYWKAALRPFVRTWLELEDNLYGRGLNLQDYPEIRFPAESQQDPQELAQIASMNATSQSASVMTRVRSLHPEWDGETVNAEVERIYQEQGIGPAAVPDAATYRGILDQAQQNPMTPEEAAQFAREHPAGG